MSYGSLLVHPLAIVTPGAVGDPAVSANLDEYGQPIAATPSVVLVQGMVQPRSSKEVLATDSAGPEIGSHVIFLLPRKVSATAYIIDADGSGPLAGGRRFQIIGIRSYEFGSQPHLEIDARIVGTTEGPTVPDGS